MFVAGMGLRLNTFMRYWQLLSQLYIVTIINKMPAPVSEAKEIYLIA